MDTRGWPRASGGGPGRLLERASDEGLLTSPFVGEVTTLAPIDGGGTLSAGGFLRSGSEARKRLAWRRRRRKHGAGRGQAAFEIGASRTLISSGDLIAVDEAPGAILPDDPLSARIVNQRHLAGQASEREAERLALSERTVHAQRGCARAWQRVRVHGEVPA